MYSWYHRHLYVTPVFLVLCQGPRICLSFCFFKFSLYDPLERQNLQDGKFLIFVNMTSDPLAWGGGVDDPFVFQNPKEFYASHSFGRVFIIFYSSRVFHVSIS